MVNKLSRGLTIWLKEPVFGDIKAYNAGLVRWMVNGQKGWTVEGDYKIPSNLQYVDIRR